MFPGLSTMRHTNISGEIYQASVDTSLKNLGIDSTYPQVRGKFRKTRVSLGCNKTHCHSRISRCSAVAVPSPYTSDHLVHQKLGVASNPRRKHIQAKKTNDDLSAIFIFSP